MAYLFMTLAAALEQRLLALFDGGVSALRGKNGAVAGVVVAILDDRCDALELRRVRLVAAGSTGGAALVDRLPTPDAKSLLPPILNEALALALLDIAAQEVISEDRES